LRTSLRTHADAQRSHLQPARKASTAISESICVFSTGALKEFIKKFVRTEKVEEVTRVLLAQQVTNIVLLKKLSRKWLIEHLGHDVARDILIASFDEQVIHPTHTHAHPTSKMASHQILAMRTFDAHIIACTDVCVRHKGHLCQLDRFRSVKLP
jgi:hypothetical protein